MTEKAIVDSAGWIGVAALLAGYGLVSLKKMEGDSVIYQILNIIGASLLVYNSYYFNAFPSVVINIIWAIIGVYALLHRIFTAGNQ